MKFIKKHKAAIVFYLLAVSCALILSYSNKHYDNKKVYLQILGSQIYKNKKYYKYFLHTQL